MSSDSIAGFVVLAHHTASTMDGMDLMWRMATSIASSALAALLVTGTANADDVMADKSRTVVTEDGWNLRVTKTHEVITPVPNFAATPFSHEAFVNLKAIADITGRGRKPVNSGALVFGYQIGCQVNVAGGVNVGLGAYADPYFSLGPGSGPSVGGDVEIGPSININLKPGTITNVPFGQKALAGNHASTAADQVELKLDGCAGAVTIRSYAIAAMATSDADNAVAVYGDPDRM
jgi:hypothetical protein